MPRAPWHSYSRSTSASESSARLTVSSTRLGSSTAKNERSAAAGAQRTGESKRAASATTPASRQPPVCGITA